MLYYYLGKRHEQAFETTIEKEKNSDICKVLR